MAAIIAFASTACSSARGSANSSGSTTTAGPGSAAETACLTATNNFLKPYDSLPTALPTELTPLPAKPKPGGLIVRIVNGQIAGDVTGGQAVVQAARAVGWTGKAIVYDGSVQDLNAKFEEAISMKPTAIVTAGLPASSIAQPLADAKKAGIITNLFGVTDAPNATAGPTSVTSGAAAFKLAGEINAYLALRDAGCKSADMLVANLPYPSLVAEQNGFQQVIAAHCLSCKVTIKPLQSADVSSAAATGAIVSSIQANPKIKYLYAVVGNLADGMPAALSTDGISGVKIFGAVPDNQSVQGLQNNTMAWWITQDATMGAWLQVDTVLRVLASGGKPVTENGEPYGVLTPQNIVKDAKMPPTYPTNYQSLFKHLWRVGG
jgi:ABC-type sugar transport system substrate-binding protein